MNKCLICQANKPYPICLMCLRNPFLVEKARQVLAQKNDQQTLKVMYLKKMPEINNLNSSSFWDKKFIEESDLRRQDGMTKDRIRVAYKFLPQSAKKVLDIGAGHGFIEELLSKNKKTEVFANDISGASVKKLKKKFKGEFRKESIYEMIYPKKIFDAIFLLEVLEHIPPSSSLTILKRIKSHLKKDGCLIISVPTNEGLENMRENPSGHVRMYTERLITAELKMVGFKIQEIKTLYAFKNLYILKKILSNIFKKKWKPNNIVIKAKNV